MRQWVLGVVTVGGLGAAAVGGIINVPEDFATIQTAIDAAQDGDEIVVAAGTYSETIDFLGKALAVRSSAGADATTIDGQSSGTVVTCASGEGPDAILEGFTIRGGSGTEVTDSFSWGGGMYIGFSSPTVRDCIFVGSAVGGPGVDGYGGGLAVNVGSPTVVACQFAANHADKLAGGLYSTGDPAGNDLAGVTVDKCTFSENTCDDNGGGMVLANGGFSSVSNCLFVRNRATTNGGLSANGSSGGI